MPTGALHRDNGVTFGGSESAPDLGREAPRPQLVLRLQPQQPWVGNPLPQTVRGRDVYVRAEYLGEGKQLLDSLAYLPDLSE